MAIGERIHFFRTLRGMTQKYLGQAIGFSEGSADVRMAQYETGYRNPKDDAIHEMALILDISPAALNVPDIDTDIGLMHTLFALEDTRGLRIEKIGERVCLCVDSLHSSDAQELQSMLCAWQEKAAKLQSGELTREDYDRWRYRYPEAVGNSPAPKMAEKKAPEKFSKVLLK